MNEKEAGVGPYLKKVAFQFRLQRRGPILQFLTIDCTDILSELYC